MGNAILTSRNGTPQNQDESSGCKIETPAYDGSRTITFSKKPKFISIVGIGISGGGVNFIFHPDKNCGIYYTHYSGEDVTAIGINSGISFSTNSDGYVKMTIPSNHTALCSSAYSYSVFAII